MVVPQTKWWLYLSTCKKSTYKTKYYAKAERKRVHAFSRISMFCGLRRLVKWRQTCIHVYIYTYLRTYIHISVGFIFILDSQYEPMCNLLQSFPNTIFPEVQFMFRKYLLEMWEKRILQKLSSRDAKAFGLNEYSQQEQQQHWWHPNQQQQHS